MEIFSEANHMHSQARNIKEIIQEEKDDWEQTTWYAMKTSFDEIVKLFEDWKIRFDPGLKE